MGLEEIFVLAFTVEEVEVVVQPLQIPIKPLLLLSRTEVVLENGRVVSRRHRDVALNYNGGEAMEASNATT